MSYARSSDCQANNSLVGARTSHSNSTLSVEELSDKVKKKLAEFLKGKFAKVDLEVLTKAIRIPNKVEFDSVSIRIPNKMKINKRVSVWVALMSNGKQVTQIPVWIKLQVFDYVLVANDKIQSKQRIESQMYTKELRNITGISEQVISELSHEKKFWSQSRIKAGEILSNKSIVLEPLVKRSQQIKVEYVKNGISISMQGKALKSGNIGDEIRVKLEQSTRPVKAIVQGQAKAKIKTESSDV